MDDVQGFRVDLRSSTSSCNDDLLENLRTSKLNSKITFRRTVFTETLGPCTEVHDVTFHKTAI